MTNAHQNPGSLPDPTYEVCRSSPWINFFLSDHCQGVIITDAMGRVTRMNRAAESLTGFSESQATGKPVSEIFRVVDESSGRPLEPLVVQVLQSATAAADRAGVRLVSHDGSILAIRERAAAVRTDAGALIGAITSFHAAVPGDPVANPRPMSLGHDMSNLLLPLLLRLDALEETPLTPEAKEDVCAIREAARSLQKLAATFRLLAQGNEAARSGEKTLVGPWWNEASGALRSALPRGLTLTAELSASHEAAISKAALTKVVFSLVQSLGDARADQSGQVLIRAWDEPDFVCLSVEYTSSTSVQAAAPNSGDAATGVSTIRIPRTL